MKKIALLVALVIGATLVAIVRGLGPEATEAASHREAPAISQDPTADITDFYMFRSYEAGKQDKVVLLMDVIPNEEPSSGPNYWNFSPNVRYSFNIDNDRDGKADDVRFVFQFRNQFRGISKDAKLFLPYVALPPITKLNGKGSEGLGFRQRYTIQMVKNGVKTTLATNRFAVPSNVGPRTMPDYESLARQGIYDLGNGVRVFAGQRQDPFYIDLGGVFDTLHLRRDPLPLLTPAEDENDAKNAFGVDQLAGFNVHTIALELPASMLTKDGKGPEATAFSKIGAYASTERKRLKRTDDGTCVCRWVQVQRLANPLVNEVIIGNVDKDRWNRMEPEDEARFEDYYLNPRLALALELVYNVPAAKSGRVDLRDLLLKYQPSDRQLAELLRLDLKVPPRPLATQRRLTVLDGDVAGWPNGRRPKDDVTDIGIRVVGGPNYIAGRAGDGINHDDAPLRTTFPFLATPVSGFDVGAHS